MTAMAPGDTVVVAREHVGEILDRLRDDGYRLVGPTVRDGAIVHGELGGVDDLPIGWTEAQEAGRYRLVRRDDAALFGYAVGPHAWKQLFFVPTVKLWRARRKDGSFTLLSESAEDPPLALIGARACDLAAVRIQDRILLGDRFADPDYAARRRGTFVVAVQCGAPGGTCFCVSMGTGPRADAGFDLALTELLAGRHRFLVEVGSDAGAALAARVTTEPASDADRQAARRVTDESARHMGRRFDNTDIRGLLFGNLEHPRWDDVASRCLGCTNCTLVCPTCFCASVTDTTDLSGDEATRVRAWDSCFTPGHSYIHGGPVHASIKSRYRQWLTHKVASWIDQFGMSGCVGCGRCITWCPVGIDITEEVAAIRAGDQRPPGA
jgi:ferredoxin